MPGLGDALSKAMNDSRRGLDDLVRRAAENEDRSSPTEGTGAIAPAPSGAAASAPRPSSAGRSAPVSQGEREFLVVPLGDAREVPPAQHGTKELPAQSSMPRTEQLPRLDRNSPPRPPPSSPARAAAPMASAVEPIAPFAPSGVIRRQLRRPARTGGKSGSRGELLVSGTDRRPIFEEVPGCRLLPVFPGADAYRIPALVGGVGGVVQAVLAGKAGTPAMLAFCGAARAAGSTTVAAAVALALAAQARVRVLLVAADFRSPGLEGLVGGDEGLGLAEVLVGGTSLENALVCSQSESLAVLPLGRPATPAGELFGVARLLEGPALGRMLEGCRGLFDAVLFDAGDTGWSGAAMLAGVVGSAVLVVRFGQTSARETRRARRALGRYGARVVGAILNGAPVGAER